MKSAKLFNFCPITEESNLVLDQLISNNFSNRRTSFRALGTTIATYSLQSRRELLGVQGQHYEMRPLASEAQKMFSIAPFRLA